ncbi:MAG: hypothetical protein CO021_00615 [Deltaproteobacteria bacterium CG_4_9_14_0_2_um_filter_42_21]|nr:MAG: hypothetical protein CO021_00615 [Deltaproteobacteria bacterium CG_4_9_14_0_2_um_filter_42_21]
MRYKGIKFLENLQAEGKRVVSLEETQKRLRLSRVAALKLLSRLQKSQRLVTLTDGLYALVPPSERRHGLHPLPVLHQLMKFCNVDYYVGLLSAAEHWGAAHHRPQVLQVMVPRLLPLRRAKKMRFDFHVRKHFPLRGITSFKTDSGPVGVSSRELTALDVLTYMSACAGFDNVGLILQELSPQLKEKELFALLDDYRPISSIQRLGVFLEFFGDQKRLVQRLKKYIQELKPSPVLLLPGEERRGDMDVTWSVLMNTEMEFEE